MLAQGLQSCLTLCDPVGCSPPGSSVQGILQARILEWVALSSCRGSSQPRDRPASLTPPALAGVFFTTGATWIVLYCSVAQSCLTLCDPMDCSTSGFPVLHHLLELAQTHVCWVGDATQPSCTLSSPGKPTANFTKSSSDWVTPLTKNVHWLPINNSYRIEIQSLGQTPYKLSQECLCLSLVRCVPRGMGWGPWQDGCRGPRRGVPALEPGSPQPTGALRCAEPHRAACLWGEQRSRTASGLYQQQASLVRSVTSRALRMRGLYQQREILWRRGRNEPTLTAAGGSRH